ncbi:M48 family metallopeptidase [Planococcus maritimus]|uniref:M48 family metallopeptidase n=1 Tax=Planococcus maritimus TaxID=192421 RepID=UPI000797A0C4|nr:heat-shock protein HtpX [Planococcus maritimus]
MSRTNIQSDRESIYFILSVIFSVLIYVLAAVSIIGIGIALTVFAFLLFANAVMLGSIRGNGVRIHERQFPDVYERVQTLSAQMELSKVPDVFVIQSEGALNAFATRFFGRDMVVLYSEVFELAREQGQAELDFIIAHELTHIKRRHVWKNLLILPAGFIPFLSTAYSRSCEYTCDRQAAFEIQDAAAAKRALTLLGIGKKAYLEVNEDAYREQIATESNAIVWLSEVLSTHPRLPKRIQSIDQFNKADVVFYQPKHGRIALGAIAVAVVMSLAYAGVVGIFTTTAAIANSFLPEFDDAFYDEMYTVEGETPLMTAAADGDLAGVEQALADGEDIHAKDSEGSDALMYAIYWGDPGVIQTLVDAGADVNTSDIYMTALATAIMYEDYESAKLLIENGADPAFEGPEGLSAIDEMGVDSEEEFLEMLEQDY